MHNADGGQGEIDLRANCSTEPLMDLKRAIVVDVAASPARWTEEVATTALLIERARQCFGLQPSRLAADAATGRAASWAG